MITTLLGVPNGKPHWMEGNMEPWQAKHFKQSGQIIATSHDLTPNGGLVREIPLFRGNLAW